MRFYVSPPRSGCVVPGNSGSFVGRGLGSPEGEPPWGVLPLGHSTGTPAFWRGWQGTGDRYGSTSEVWLQGDRGLLISGVPLRRSAFVGSWVCWGGTGGRRSRTAWHIPRESTTCPVLGPSWVNATWLKWPERRPPAKTEPSWGQGPSPSPAFCGWGRRPSLVHRTFGEGGGGGLHQGMVHKTQRWVQAQGW